MLALLFVLVACDVKSAEDAVTLATSNMHSVISAAGNPTDIETAKRQIEAAQKLLSFAKLNAKGTPLSTFEQIRFNLVGTVQRMDGGGLRSDMWVVGFYLLVGLVIAGGAFWLWKSRQSPVLRARQFNLIMLQTFGGFMWAIGFIVRFGHFERTPNSITSNCNLWSYYVSIVLGFSIWSGCILLRLLRLSCVFVYGTDTISLGPYKLHFGRQWHLLLGLLCTPHWILYGIILPLAGAVESKTIGGTTVCLYSQGNRLFAIADMGVFFAVWVLMLCSVHMLRAVKDELGEYNAIRRALFVSLATLACTIIAEILQIDGLFIGRTVVSGSVVASVASFFFLQNADIFRALSGAAVKNTKLKTEGRTADEQQDTPNRPSSPTLATKVEEALAKLEGEKVGCLLLHVLDCVVMMI
jgi:hypothetical protein